DVCSSDLEIGAVGAGGGDQADKQDEGPIREAGKPNLGVDERHGKVSGKAGNEFVCENGHDQGEPEVKEKPEPGGDAVGLRLIIGFGNLSLRDQLFVANLHDVVDSPDGG